MTMQFFKLVLFFSAIMVCFLCILYKDICLFHKCRQVSHRQQQNRLSQQLPRLLQARTLARCPQNKRRTPSWHPSLSILTSSPFASSGSVSFPQLIRKATHRRTSSKIQPLFLIRNLHFAPHPDFKSQIFHLQLFNMHYFPAFSQ